MNSIARVNLYYSVLLIGFGMCIGYYILSNLFRPSEKYIFEQGIVYGVLTYRDHLQNMATFEIVSDSIVIIKTNHDSLTIYK
jgi:hypothetical protein